MFFHRKKPTGMKPAELQKYHNTPLLYAAVRDENGKEVIVGREGAINVLDGEVFVVCSGNRVFSAPLSETMASLLMSNNGIVFRKLDKITGEKVEVTAYFARWQA